MASKEIEILLKQMKGIPLEEDIKIELVTLDDIYFKYNDLLLRVEKSALPDELTSIDPKPKTTILKNKEPDKT